MPRDHVVLCRLRGGKFWTLAGATDDSGLRDEIDARQIAHELEQEGFDVMIMKDIRPTT